MSLFDEDRPVVGLRESLREQIGFGAASTRPGWCRQDLHLKCTNGACPPTIRIQGEPGGAADQLAPNLLCWKPDSKRHVWNMKIHANWPACLTAVAAAIGWQAGYKE